MNKFFDFYFDFASPFGFLANHKISALAQAIGRDVNWHPFLIGAVYKEYGGAPIGNPLKFDYIFKDFFRRAKLNDLDNLKTPANFPSSTVLPSRLAYWVEREAPEKMGAFIKTAYQAYWVDGKDTADVNAALDAAVSVGFDRDAAAAGAQEQDIKDRLRFETENALARGVFGSPFILIDEEPFWGEDRFEDIVRLYG